MKQFHHGSGWKKFRCCIEDIVPPCKWRINHDNLLEGQEETFSCGFKRERPAGAGSERSFSCRVHCELRCWNHGREAVEEEGQVLCLLPGQAPQLGSLDMAYQAVLQMGSDLYVQHSCPSRKQSQKLRTERKAEIVPSCSLVFGELYTKLMMICDCWTPCRCLCVLFCGVFLRGGCLDVGFGLFDGFWVAFLMLTKHPKSELGTHSRKDGFCLQHDIC